MIGNSSISVYMLDYSVLAGYWAFRESCDSTAWWIKIHVQCSKAIKTVRLHDKNMKRAHLFFLSWFSPFHKSFIWRVGRPAPLFTYKIPPLKKKRKQGYTLLLTQTSWGSFASRARFGRRGGLIMNALNSNNITYLLYHCVI